MSSTTTYVKSIDAFKSDTGRVTFVNVELATGHKWTCQPQDAPKVGDHFVVTTTPVES